MPKSAKVTIEKVAKKFIHKGPSTISSAVNSVVYGKRLILTPSRRYVENLDE